MIPSPMLLQSCAALPRGTGWVFEPKWDGYRCIARVAPDGVALWTRHGTPLTERVPTVAAALADLPVGTVVDGELVARAASGDGGIAQDWEALGALWRGGAVDSAIDVRLICFDCLEADGEPLDDRPWQERRARLDDLLHGIAPFACATTVYEPDPALHGHLSRLASRARSSSDARAVTAGESGAARG